jgi:hypothetical protein
MQFAAAKQNGGGGSDPVDDLVRQIARLVRHPAYRRNAVVSALLLRHLPVDGGFAWQGEASLRDRLKKAQLDPATLGHLAASARTEMARLRGPADA